MTSSPSTTTSPRRGSTSSTERLCGVRSRTGACTRTGQLIVTDNAAGSPHTVNVSGTGSSVATPPPTTCGSGCNDFYVSASAGASGDGSAAHPWSTLNQGISSATLGTKGTVLHVADGTYVESATSCGPISGQMTLCFGKGGASGRPFIVQCDAGINGTATQGHCKLRMSGARRRAAPQERHRAHPPSISATQRERPRRPSGLTKAREHLPARRSPGARCHDAQRMRCSCSSANLARGDRRGVVFSAIRPRFWPRWGTSGPARCVHYLPSC